MLEGRCAIMPDMNIAAMGVLAHALLTFVAGAVSLVQAEGIATVVIALVFAAGLLFAGYSIRKGSYAALYAGLGIIMFLGGFFGFQFIASGNFLPSGFMLIFSFLALGVVSGGLFASLIRE